MKHHRFGFIRVLALIAMMFSMSGVFSLTASAAPGNAGTTLQAQAQDSGLCTTLYNDDVVDEQGNYIRQDGWGLTWLGQANSLREAYGLQVGVGTSIVRDGGCVGLVEVPPATFSFSVYATSGSAVIPDASVNFGGLENGVTGADGGFTTAGMYEAGDYEVTVSALGYISQTQTISFGAETLSWSFVLEPIPAQTYQWNIFAVYDGGDGAFPVIEGATVTFTDEGIDESGETGADGRFTTTGAYEAGTFNVTVSADGFETKSQAIAFNGETQSWSVVLEPVEVPAPEPVIVGVDVVAGESGLSELPDGAEIEVLDEDGDSVAGSSVGGVELPLTGVSYELPDGDATYTVRLVGADADSHEVEVANGVVTPGTVTLTLAPAEQPEPPVTHPVEIVAETEDGGSAEGAFVYLERFDSDGEILTFLQPVPDPDGVLDADNSFLANLEAGDYAVLIDAIDQGYGFGFAEFTVPVEGPVVVELERFELGDEGLVHIHHYVCDGLDEVVFSDDMSVVREDCAPAVGVFTFYLYGDGTDDHWQAKTGRNGVIGIELMAGTYEVVHEATQAKADVEVVAGEVTELVVLSPVADDAGDGDADNGKDEDGKKDDEKASEVTDLPTTGTGHAAGSMQAATMLAAAAAMAATAGGVVLRQKRG